MSRFRAVPYARALFEAAGTADKAQDFVQPLAEVCAAFEQVPELQRAMVTPTVAPETKTAILDAVLNQLGVTGMVARFVHVLQGNYRTEHLPAVVEVYRDIVDRAQGRGRGPGQTAAGGRRGAPAPPGRGLGGGVGAPVVPAFLARAGTPARGWGPGRRSSSSRSRRTKARRPRPASASPSRTSPARRRSRRRSATSRPSRASSSASTATSRAWPRCSPSTAP